RRHPDQAKRPQAAQQAPEPAGPRAQEPAGQDRWDSVTRRIAGVSEHARVAQARIDALRDLRMPSRDPEAPDLGPAWTLLPSRDRGAIVQPPRQEIAPAREIQRRADAHRAAAVPEAENS
ncbi:MAG: hypothetical protein ACRDNZ_19045, partial [Streptosporangiaceae bacterium]